MVRRLMVHAKREKFSQPQLFKAFAQLLAEYRDDIVERAERGAIPEELLRQLHAPAPDEKP